MMVPEPLSDVVNDAVDPAERRKLNVIPIVSPKVDEFMPLKLCEPKLVAPADERCTMNGSSNKVSTTEPPVCAVQSDVPAPTVCSMPGPPLVIRVPETLPLKVNEPDWGVPASVGSAIVIK